MMRIKHGGGKMSRAIHIKKSITFLVIMTFFLTACSADSLVEIENRDAQFQEVNKQLKDLKQIKVKGLDDDQMEKNETDCLPKLFPSSRRHKTSGKEGY